MMGDFNAKVGCSNKDVKLVMGKHGIGDCNGNGELLIQTCGNHGLMAGEILFPHKECHKATLVTPDPHNKIQNQTYHIRIRTGGSHY
jgi:hypothetical protein